MTDPIEAGPTLEDVLQRASEVALASDLEIARYERERSQSLRSELLHGSGVADVLSEHAFGAIVRDECEPTKAVELVRGWLASRWPVLVLLGPPGLGKTVAAGWLLARHAGRYLEAGEVCRMRSSFEAADRDAWRRTLKCEMLIVDELGCEERKDANATLQDVVNARQRKPRRTVLMGNLSAEAFRDRYDPRTLDRLREIGVMKGLRGNSMRGAK